MFKPYRMSKNCDVNTQTIITSWKNRFYIAFFSSIVVISTCGIGLYYAMETTVFFRLNEYDEAGLPLGRSIPFNNFPNENVTILWENDSFPPPEYQLVRTYQDYNITRDNITKMDLRFSGFIFIEEPLAQFVFNNLTIYSQFLLIILMVYGYQGMLDSQVYQLAVPKENNILLDLIDMVESNRITYISSLPVNEFGFDLVWRFPSSTYCIPLFQVDLEFLDNRDIPDPRSILQIPCVWTQPFILDDISKFQLKRGIWEMIPSDYVFNKDAFYLYSKIRYGQMELNDFENFNQFPIEFTNNWLYRSWTINGKTIFTPITNF